MFWIQCEDFVTAFVGPFASVEAAQHHIDQVIVPRGDSSTNSVIRQDEFDVMMNELSVADRSLIDVLSPEDDFDM